VLIIAKYKGKSKIGLDARKLKDGTIKKKGIGIKSPYSHKELCKKVKNKFGGKWKPKKKMWSYPLEIEVVDYATEIWSKKGFTLEKSGILKEWYEKRKIERENLLINKDREEVRPEELDTELANTLYDFQRVGVNFLTETKGAILGFDMGLGKTITSLAVSDIINASKVLIVCPASLKYNWAEEIEKWLPNKKYSILDGSKKKRIKALNSDVDFYITNYASLREKSRVKVNGNWIKIDNELFKEINKQNFDIGIYDEIHRAKNRKSQQTKALYKIANGIDRNYLLTGTPIINTPEDLWSLLHIIDRNKFSSFWRFVHRYCEVWDNGFGKEIGSAKNPKEFREMLKPYMLRRLKEEVIEGMPELTKQKQWVELEGEQNKIYHQMEKNMIAELSEQEEIKAPIIISKIMRLKQISVSEQLLAEKPSLKKFKKSAKIKVLNEIIDDSGDQKLVVFTQFQKSAKLLAKLLDKQKIGYGIIHGGVKTEQRQKEVNKFQNNKDCKVFIATIKTGGLGLTLTAGSIAVFLDKDWTTANNNQAVDRLHRIGQEKNVTVIELLAKDSIEEYIEKLLAEKQKTFDSLIEGKITPKEILLNLKGSD